MCILLKFGRGWIQLGQSHSDSTRVWGRFFDCLCTAVCNVYLARGANVDLRSVSSGLSQLSDDSAQDIATPVTTSKQYATAEAGVVCYKLAFRCGLNAAKHRRTDASMCHIVTQTLNIQYIQACKGNDGAQNEDWRIVLSKTVKHMH